jgi:hypothetical protein
MWSEADPDNYAVTDSAAEDSERGDACFHRALFVFGTAVRMAKSGYTEKLMSADGCFIAHDVNVMVRLSDHRVRTACFPLTAASSSNCGSMCIFSCAYLAYVVLQSGEGSSVRTYAGTQDAGVLFDFVIVIGGTIACLAAIAYCKSENNEDLHDAITHVSVCVRTRTLCT